MWGGHWEGLGDVGGALSAAGGNWEDWGYWECLGGGGVGDTSVNWAGLGDTESVGGLSWGSVRMGVGGAGRHWGHWELLGWELGALSEAGAHRDSNHPPKAQQVPPMAEGPPEPPGAGEHWSLCPHLLCHPVSPGCHPLCPGCHPGVTPCHLVVTTRSAGPRPPLTLCAPSRCPQHQVRLSLVHTAPQLPPSAPSKPSTCHPPPPPSAGCWRRRRGGAKLWGRSLRQKGGGAMAWRWSLR